jgi:hypothetical protein
MTPDLAWWGRLAAFLAAQTALIVGAATLVNHGFRATQARRVVWQAALIAVACVWLGETAGLGEKVRRLGPREAAGIVQAAVQFSTVRTPAAAAGPAEAPLPVHREQSAAPVTWPGVIWLLGSLLLLLRCAANRVWLAWQRRRMAPADAETQKAVARLGMALGLSGVETRTWARLRGPMAFGWWRPTVVVPADFSLRFTTEQREAMVAHELAHLAGRDPLWLGLADAICALAWWNPMAWWAALQLRGANESAADEASALAPSGPTALAESLLRFGRELAESGPARGLGVAGNGFRSGLGRRVHALLTSPVRWRELPALWRWAPRILALGFVLALTALPVLSGPSGSVFGWLVQSAGAQAGVQTPGRSRLVLAQPAEAHPQNPVAWFTNGVMADSNTPPIMLPSGTTVAGLERGIASNGLAASNTLVLQVKMAGILAGGPAQAAMDKLFGQLPPDQSAGPEAVAQFLREAKILHTENIRTDYHVTKGEAVPLTTGQFQKALDAFERDSSCNIISFPNATASLRTQTQLGVEDVLRVVTGVTAGADLAADGATNGYVNYLTDEVRTGVTAKILPIVSAEGWDLSVLSRNTTFLGYDKPGHPEKNYTLPLPHIRVSEIQGKGTVRMGETLALRGPACTATNKITDTVLGLFHRTHSVTVTTRTYLFVTPSSGTK